MSYANIFICTFCAHHSSNILVHDVDVMQNLLSLMLDAEMVSPGESGIHCISKLGSLLFRYIILPKEIFSG